MAITACHCDFSQRRSGSVYPVSAYFLMDQKFDTAGETQVYNGLEAEGVGHALGEGITSASARPSGTSLIRTFLH